MRSCVSAVLLSRTKSIYSALSFSRNCEFILFCSTQMDAKLSSDNRVPRQPKAIPKGSTSSTRHSSSCQSMTGAHCKCMPHVSFVDAKSLVSLDRVSIGILRSSRILVGSLKRPLTRTIRCTRFTLEIVSVGQSIPSQRWNQIIRSSLRES